MQTESRAHRKLAITLIRPYQLGECMDGIIISEKDTPKPGGLVCVNPDDPKDQWYISQEYYESSYELV